MSDPELICPTCGQPQNQRLTPESLRLHGIETPNTPAWQSNQFTWTNTAGFATRNPTLPALQSQNKPQP